jgi:hypothetical protein
VRDLMIAFGQPVAQHVGVRRVQELDRETVLGEQFLCWAAKIGKLDRPGKTITLSWVWAGAALMAPNIIAQASVPIIEMRVGSIVIAGPPGFVVRKV